VIDLHLHTTASDGRLSPGDLVATAAAAGVSTLAVTDHDTLAGLDAASAAAAALGLPFVRGIEITAVDAGRDVHVLGYFVDRPDDRFLEFLADQRADRRSRASAMMVRLAEAGAPVDEDAVFGPGGRASAGDVAVGRPALGRALVAAGHVRDLNDAFDRYLAEGRLAFVARTGASPEDVVASLARIGAVASIAHPGKLKDDGLISRVAAAGLKALEVFHPDHDVNDTTRYAKMAAKLGLVPTGGSDYHGPDTDRARGLGRIGPSDIDFARLVALGCPLP
jgi:predicted metal-dependent phosphoesterase TrpH